MPQDKKVTVVKTYSQLIRTNLTNAKSDDVFLTKYDRRGNLVWVEQAGGAMTAACVRRGYLEKLHAGITPVTRTGDYSDVKVFDAEGREIPWNQVSHINQNEMKTLITGVVNRIHTFLARTLFSATEDKAFEQALDRAAAPWTKAWDEPQYLADFLMPHPEKQE